MDMSSIASAHDCPNQINHSAIAHGGSIAENTPAHGDALTCDAWTATEALESNNEVVQFCKAHVI